MNRSSLLTILVVVVLIPPILYGQTTDLLPEDQLSQQEVEAHLRFLSDDILRGRYTGSTESAVVAAFIANTLQSLGYQSPDGYPNYLQAVPIQAVQPPAQSTMTVQTDTYAHLDKYLILSGEPIDTVTEAVFAGYGWINEDGHDDYAGLEVEGKTVFVLPGTPEGQDPNTVFKSMAVKRELAAARGAVALFELYRLSFPWPFFKQYFGKESMRLKDESNGNLPLTYGWIQDISSTEAWAAMQAGEPTMVDLNSTGFRKRPVSSHNVVAILPGTDSVLSQEYIVLTAHYDHVGVGSQGGQFSETDSIFNGARDNAMGVVALLAAAKSLALQVPKRSVVILAVTGEELGLLGSSYYADHPAVPLEQTIFNLNMDGAGYNSTEHVAVFGYNRTGIEPHLIAASSKTNLSIVPDPSPQQNLYDRSDNVSFAAKGVPAITLSPGLTDFDDEIGKYYHRPADEASTVDMDYLLKYCKTVAHTARLVADAPQRPFWTPGDVYESAGQDLYGKE